MDTNIAELTKEIAQYLEGWEAIEKDVEDYAHYGKDNGWLAHESGAQIHLWRPWNRTRRVTISGSYPRSSDEQYYPVSGYGREKRPKITCAISRGSEAIAKDILKRLLPSYLNLYQQAQERVADYESDKASEAALMGRLGQACGIPVDNGHRGNLRIDGDCGPVWVEIKPYGDNAVEMSLRKVPADFAEKLCKFLALLQEPKKA